MHLYSMMNVVPTAKNYLKEVKYQFMIGNKELRTGMHRDEIPFPRTISCFTPG